MSGSNPNDEQVLSDIEKQIADGGDPFGDNDPIETIDEATDTDPETPAQSSNDAPADNAATKPDEDPLGLGKPDGGAPADGEPAADVLEEIAAPRDEAPIRYEAALPEDYKQKRTDLLAEKAQTMKKLMDGEIDAEQFSAEETRISTALEDLTAARIRAETLQAANEQATQRYTQQTLNRLAARVKSEIDYTADADAAKQFDRALSLLSGDPAKVNAPFADLADEAHRMVMAMRGVAAKPAAAAPPAAPPSRRPNVTPPTTLRSVPAASGSNTGGGVADHMANLSGVAYEEAYAKLTPNQRAALLDEE